MTVIVKLGEEGTFLATPRVHVRAVLPLPGRNPGEVDELDLLEMSGPPEVVAAAMERLGDYLDDLVPLIAAHHSGDAGLTPPAPQER